MRPELETYQLIDTYLNGMLTGEALQAFEQKLQSDASFAEEVSFQQLTNEVVVGASFDSLRTQMKSDIASIDSSTNNRTWGLTGLLLGIVSVGVIGMYTLSSDPEETALTVPVSQDSSPVPTKKSVNQTLNNTSETGKTPEKTIVQSGTILRNTDIAQDQVTEHIPVQTPVQQAIPDQSTAEKPIVKSAEAIQQTPVFKTSTINPCELVAIKATITSSPSCDDASTGSITIPLDQISGGTKPYHITFNKSKETGKKELYAYLSPGVYAINITDATGCSKNFSSEVAEKNCRKASYVFAPDKGQVCTITGKDHEDYILSIFTMAGRQVYKTNTMNGSFEWQGISQQGEYLQAGLYIYILEYVSGEKENGQITIVR